MKSLVEKPCLYHPSSLQEEKVHGPLEQEEEYNGVGLKSEQNTPCVYKYQEVPVQGMFLHPQSCA